jgi:carboxylesterase
MENKTAFILIHGFGGDTSEIKPLANKLESMGYDVSCTELKGHTGKRRDMAGISHQDWISSVEADYKKLADKFNEIILIGFSTGGLIALNLALKYEVNAIVTISTPIYVWDIRQVIKNMTTGTKSSRSRNLKWYIYSATSFPISSLIQFQILLHKTKAILPRVVCPIFVLQGLDDDTVNSKSASFIYNKVSSKIKKLHFLKNAGHVVLKGTSSEEAIQEIQIFFDSLDI